MTVCAGPGEQVSESVRDNVIICRPVCLQAPKGQKNANTIRELFSLDRKLQYKNLSHKDSEPVPPSQKKKKKRNEMSFCHDYPVTAVKTPITDCVDAYLFNI